VSKRPTRRPQLRASRPRVGRAVLWAWTRARPSETEALTGDGRGRGGRGVPESVPVSARRAGGVAALRTSIIAKATATIAVVMIAVAAPNRKCVISKTALVIATANTDRPAIIRRLAV
jgi:hypothetical protein